ncbi:hypothetical protein AAA162_12445 [Parabacteroides johnsonii]|uniref:hypothetical protein n=1 Tax=Parabacteroides johnsonii TaxID=387661 RepID=UPI0032C0EB65
MKIIEAVELFAILKDLKLSGMETLDRLKVIRNLRALREVADKYNADMDLAKERLKPDDYDGLVMKMLESNEAVASGGNRTVSDLEIASFNKMNELFNRDLKAIQIGSYNKGEKCFEGGMNNEPVDVKIETLTELAFDKLVDANKDVPAGALAVLFDKMVK